MTSGDDFGEVKLKTDSSRRSDNFQTAVRCAAARFLDQLLPGRHRLFTPRSATSDTRDTPTMWLASVSSGEISSTPRCCGGSVQQAHRWGLVTPSAEA